VLFKYAAECFVVRPENSEDNRKIGSRGSLCLLHVSKWGLTLALQVNGQSIYMLSANIGGWLSVVVTMLVIPTKLSFVEPG